MSRYADPSDYFDARDDYHTLDAQTDRRGTRGERQLEDRIHGEDTPRRKETS